MIASDPKYFLRRHIAGQVKIEGAVDQVALVEYFSTTNRAITEDVVFQSLEQRIADPPTQVGSRLVLR